MSDVTPQTPPADGGKVKTRMIYLGQGINSKNQLFYQWALTDQPNDGTRLDRKKAKIWTFSKISNKTLYLNIGNIFIFDVVTGPNDSATVWFTNPPKLSDIEQWANDEDLTEWSLEQRAARGAKSARAKLDKTDDRWRDGLDPYKRQYQRATGAERAALLAAIILEITGGR